MTDIGTRARSAPATAVTCRGRVLLVLALIYPMIVDSLPRSP